MKTLRKLLMEKYWMSGEDIGRENQIIKIVKVWLEQKRKDYVIGQFSWELLDELLEELKQ